MKHVFTIVLVLFVSNLKWAASGPQHGKDFCSKILDSTDFESSNLSPFSFVLYKLLKKAGIFDALFSVSLTPKQAAIDYSKVAKDFSNQLDSTVSDDLVRRVSKAAENAFEDGITPLEYLKVYTVTTQSNLVRNGVLTEDNFCNLVESYFEELYKAYLKYDVRNHPEFSTVALGISGANFLLRTFDVVSHRLVAYTLSKFADELNKISK